MKYHYVFLPTLKCNMACAYCYQGHAGPDMSPEVVAALKLHLAMRLQNGMDAMHAAFFGGEPLLCKDTVLDLAAFAKSGIEAAGGQFEGSMTTNGTLLCKETLYRLAEQNIRGFQITLDGPREVHDGPLGRVFPSGRGSFDVIWDRLEMIHSTDLEGLEVELRVHYRPSTLEPVRRLIDRINRAFGQDPRFHVCFHPVGRWGGPRDRQIDVFGSEAEEDAAEQQLKSLLCREGMLSSVYAAEYECYASNPRSLVVMPDGRLCKCTVGFDESEVGRLLPDGRVEVNAHLLSAWGIGHVLDLPQAKRCPRKVLAAARQELGLVG